MRQPRDRTLLHLALALALTGCGDRTPEPPASTDLSAPRVQGSFPAILVSDRLFQALLLGTTPGLTLGDDNQILSGNSRFPSPRSTVCAERSLRIDRFAVPADHCIVQVDAGHGSATSVVGYFTQGTGPAPTLRDAQGRSYPPVGWVYTDDATQDIWYTPEQPVSSLDELTSAGLKISNERTDQRLRLLFLVPNGVEIDRLTIGDQALCVFDPRPIAWSPSREPTRFTSEAAPSAPPP